MQLATAIFVERNNVIHQIQTNVPVSALPINHFTVNSILQPAISNGDLPTKCKHQHGARRAAVLNTAQRAHASSRQAARQSFTPTQGSQCRRVRPGMSVSGTDCPCQDIK